MTYVIILSQLFLIRMSLSKLIIIITIIYLFLNVWTILINVGAILYGGNFEIGAILINVGSILTGAILQWGDLTRHLVLECSRS